jgi:hypothetical protein
VLDVIDRTHSSISTIYGGRNVLSLTTKFLWLHIKHPVIIYDSQARSALATRAGDIATFYWKWRDRFAEDAAAINDSCHTLPNVVEYSVNPRVGPEYVSVASTVWFKERVLDNRLWTANAWGGA